MKYFGLYIFALITSLHANAQQETIPFLIEDIKIDGKLDESVWKRAVEFSGFHNFYPNDEGLAENQTVVKVFHDGEKLYVSAVYFDRTDKNIVGSLKRDEHEGSVVSSDAFGVIIDAFNKKNNGYYFTLNTAGTQLDALVNFDGSNYNIDASWNTIWESKTSINGKQKIYEMAIPFKAINFDTNNPVWSFQFFSRDLKSNSWMTWSPLGNNFLQYDLRFAKKVTIEQIPKTNTSRFIVIPSITYNYQDNLQQDTKTSEFKPSIDAQYSITSSLRLDATINPDFSQIDVDQQVTNLTRFAVHFPERRNFFIENSDLFSNLGTNEVNPFYSRRIGASSDILLGLKLSGNITPKTRIGVLDVQTNENKNTKPQNFGALVLQQQLSKCFTATGFLLNKQEADNFEFKSDFNRVAGININYKSNNNKWTGLANLGKSFTDGISSKNQFYNIGVNYSTKKVRGELSASKVETNYLTDIGFVPRLYNYDAVNNNVIREGYTSLNSLISLFAFPESKTVQLIRYLRAGNTTYFDENGTTTQSNTFTNHAIFFKNTASAYVSLDHSYINLKYGFDPLQNGKYIAPNVYNFASVRVGYNSPFNKKVSFDTGLQYGNYYNGNRTRYYINSIYRFLPIAKIGLDYELNYLDLNVLGIKPFHLVRFTGEVFFNNRLNWTTYVQYNTQLDNFNINSRLQWEYKPLSYIYFVITDNFDKHISRTNWGIAFKMNYRFDF